MGNGCSTDTTSATTASHVGKPQPHGHRHADAAYGTVPSQRARADEDMSSAAGITSVLRDVEPSAQAVKKHPFGTVPSTGCGHSVPSDSPTSKDILSPTAVSLSGANESSISGWSVSCPFGAVHGSLAKFPPLPPPPTTDDEDHVHQPVAAAPRQRNRAPPAQQSISGWSVSSQNNCLHGSLPPPLQQRQQEQNQQPRSHSMSNLLTPVVSGDYESISDWSVLTQNQENAVVDGEPFPATSSGDGTPIATRRSTSAFSE